MNLPSINTGNFPTAQLEQILEAIISSAEINHWPADIAMLHWLGHWIEQLKERDPDDEELAVRVAVLSNRLLSFYMAGQGKKERSKSRRRGGPRPRRKSDPAGETTTVTETLVRMLERPEGASRREMLEASGWLSIAVRSFERQRPDMKMLMWAGDDGLNRYRFVPKKKQQQLDFGEEAEEQTGEGDDVFESEEEAV